MYELIFYMGAILSIVFFIASVVLFIVKKIPSVIGYLLKIGKLSIGDKHSNTDAALNIEAINAKLKSQTGEQTDILFDSGVDNEQTSLLSTVENYATSLLDADSTSILPVLKQKDQDT